MKTLALVFCTLFIPLMGVAQEEVPHRVDTNYVGKPTTEADKLLGDADEAFNNEDFDTAFKYYQKAAETGNMVVSEKVCKSSLSSLFILFIFLPFVSRISIDKFSLNMLFLFLPLQHLLVGKVPTCLMALMFSFL